ncbi:acetyl-CoA carboxylase family protein [Paraburkholderia rhynchosiae]|uniref:acetyl-CoA carboxylase n=1 Tax=Paraburkholderia rhynchosiae TaxID=487049 RepID=A0A2N7W7X3_9BURK|nr:carboxyl transferase domain-containing protein [Paraburkholderia rhynchosiae]PMS25491.1 carbamoyl-phosphate synthase large subunit [Paraburkholderia rhynchosiae]CAB3733921.1 Carbamoyl-phosphate synthase large chain [Paraburkholderia rhynchosiae]
MKRLLIANRGEVAIRIARAAADLGIWSVAVYSQDDVRSLHRLRADESRELQGSGPAAYLDISQIVAVARETACDAVHPGYGFLSESAEFARQLRAAGLTFVGAPSEVLDLFGDKGAARRLAIQCGVSVPNGTLQDTGLEEALRVFDETRSGLMVKAVSGGGGRGMRRVDERAHLASAIEVCRSEAKLAFGNEAIYVEEFVTDARHVEVQVLADSSGAITVFGERECSLQRRQQKVIEVAPAPGLEPAVRDAMMEAASKLSRAAGLIGLGTFEFLMTYESGRAHWVFIECNPRLQVEHTVTEAVFGVDLVQAQLQVAAGASLEALGMQQERIGPPNGYAIELRINMEQIVGGEVRPVAGTLSVFEPPAGPGIRVDTFGYAGFAPSPRFDALLAKLVVHAPRANFRTALNRAQRALAEFTIDGIPTNQSLLHRLLAHPAVEQMAVTTNFIEQNMGSLPEVAAGRARQFEPVGLPPTGAGANPEEDPPQDDGSVAVRSPMAGSVLELDVGVGQRIGASDRVAVLEAMKMHSEIHAGAAGVVTRVLVKVGDVVAGNAALLWVAPAGALDTGEDSGTDVPRAISLEEVPPTIEEVWTQRAATLDEQRPVAVAKRHSSGRRTARENLADLCDEGSFVEFGSLAVASMRGFDPAELRAISPSDGIVAGLATINGATQRRSRCALLAFDSTVFAGTMGMVAKVKIERLARIAGEGQIPLVIFAEGGGARSGESDGEGANGSLETFLQLARVKGRAPLIGIVAGNCFAANAALLGLCDIIIATRAASIGMAGPAMIEGAGLGRFAPEEVGPAAMQSRNGVVTVVAEDEAEAVMTARRCVGYFQGPARAGESPDQRLLRHIVPANRLLAYDIRALLSTLADKDSVVEMRPEFGKAIVTAMVRIDGIPFGILANDPRHLGGAIDADAADKAAGFLQMCETFGFPLVTLCDTPGFMVGPDAEKQALVRHVMHMMAVGANLTVPHFTVVLRKCYGLGGLTMNLGSYTRPLFHVAWPSGEYGAMNAEGSVRISHKRELAEIEDPDERRQRQQELVQAIQDRGKALRAAARGAIDEIIDPVETRRWLLAGLLSVRPINGGDLDCPT